MKNTDAINAFHKKALLVLLALAEREGIRTAEQLTALNARILFEQPFWQILECEGKYGGHLISAGVKGQEDLYGPVGRRDGVWPEHVLSARLGPAAGGGRWRDHPDYACNLEHVVERKHLLAAVLARPAEAVALLDGHLLGCVVLRSEHSRLGSVPAEIALRDPWKRYRDANPPIGVWSRRQKQWISLDLPLQKAGKA